MILCVNEAQHTVFQVDIKRYSGVLFSYINENSQLKAENKKEWSHGKVCVGLFRKH